MAKFEKKKISLIFRVIQICEKIYEYHTVSQLEQALIVPQNSSCPAELCLTLSQLRECYSAACNHSHHHMANTSLVLLPGVYASHSDHGPLFAPTRFFALTPLTEVVLKAIVSCKNT